MITEEEIRLKLGLDSKEIDEGTRRALTKIVQFGKESEKAFYEHGEKPGRAFHKVLRQLTEQFPLIGGAARIALSPIGGTLAVAVTAAIAFNENLKRIHETLDRIDKITSKGIGNIFAAKRTAGAGNAADRRRGLTEMESFSDPLADMVANAKTAADRRQALSMVESARHETAQEVIGYNSNQTGRDDARLKIAKRDEEIRSLESHLEEVKAVAESTRGSATTWERAKQGGLFEKAMAGMEFGTTAGASLVGKSVNELAEAAIPRLKRALEKEAKQRDELSEKLKDEEEAHRTSVEKLKKFDEAKQKLQDQEIAQAALQSAYDRHIAVARRNQIEAQNAPFTPGLDELSSYSGPYAYIAQEVLAGRNLAKRQAGFANPGALAALRASVNSAQYDLGNELRGATTYEGRTSALRKYSERMQGLISGRTSPEHNLEVMADGIKSLNEQAKTAGLIVRGSDL